MLVSEKRNFYEFIDAVKNYNRAEIIESAENEILEVTKHPGPKRMQRKSADYARHVNQFLYFMKKWKKPHGVYDHYYFQYRIVVENLINNHGHSAKLLGLFSEKAGP